MVANKNHIPAELTYLEATYQELLGNSQAGIFKTVSPENSFYVALSSSSKLYRHSNNRDIHLQLAKYWLHKFDKTLENIDKLEFAKHDLFNLIDDVVKHQLVHALIQDPGNAQKLAFVCITAVPLRVSDEGPCHAPVEELAQQWFGSLERTTVLRSIQEAVDIFYGPAVSLLYGNDIACIETLPSILKNNAVPLFRVGHQSGTASRNALPLDLM